jgi:hypothetical protein
MQDLNATIDCVCETLFRLPAAIDDNPDIAEYVGEM